MVDDTAIDRYDLARADAQAITDDDGIERNLGDVLHRRVEFLYCRGQGARERLGDVRRLVTTTHFDVTA